MSGEPDSAMERLIADGFKVEGTISIQEMVKALMEAARAHAGNWPSYATGCHAQVFRWGAEAMDWSLANDRTIPTTLHIMNVKVIERPGPITLIWTSQVAK